MPIMSMCHAFDCFSLSRTMQPFKNSIEEHSLSYDDIWWAHTCHYCNFCISRSISVWPHKEHLTLAMLVNLYMWLLSVDWRGKKKAKTSIDFYIRWSSKYMQFLNEPIILLNNFMLKLSVLHYACIYSFKTNHTHTHIYEQAYSIEILTLIYSFFTWKKSKNVNYFHPFAMHSKNSWTYQMIN